MRTPNFYILSIAIVCMGFLSCRKFLTIEPPSNLVTSQNLFSDETAATAAVFGEYIQTRNTYLGILNGGLSVFASLSADDLLSSVSNGTADPFAHNDILPDNNVIYNNFWSNAYRNIYHINTLITGLKSSTTIRNEVRTRLIGEVKLLRCLYYFNLTNLFGDVPFITETNYELNQKLPRNSTDIILQQITNDLIEVKNQLPATYMGSQRTRPNKFCAAALLARIYLYTKNWEAAAKEADSIINSNQYELETNLTSVFMPGSKETLWQIAKDNLNTAEGNAFVPFNRTARPSYVVTHSLLSTFTQQDKRRAWIDSSTFNNQVYYYPAKYKARGSNPISEYLVVFRFAELYLIRAEANIRMHNLQGALQDINVIRTRAGLPISIINQEGELLNLLIQERREEFFAEWGHRWFDLKRMGLAEITLSNLKAPYWQSTDTFYPIPQIELDRNPFLTQNDGY